VELKSLKLYLQSFRKRGHFYENATNRILDDLVAVLQPRRMKLVAVFTPRGGITTSIIVEHEKTMIQEPKNLRTKNQIRNTLWNLFFGSLISLSHEARLF